MTARRVIWIVGWLIVAFLVVTVLLVLFNTPSSVT
jgi:preprotein translocase subunit Sec63